MRLFICVFLISFNAFAQKSYRLEVGFSNANEHVPVLNYPKQLADSISVYSESSKIIAQLQAQGFLLAEILSVDFNEGKAGLRIDVGKKYNLKKLGVGNVSKEALAATAYKEKDLTNLILNPKRLADLFEKLVVYYENSGFPFAAVNIDSLVIADNDVSGVLNVNTFEKFVFDSLTIVGTAKINPAFLQTYLKIKPKYDYSEYRIRVLNERLRDLAYLTPLKPPSVQFSNGKASVIVFADQKDASQFDGILGIQQDAASGKTQLVGNLKLRLQNSFKRGELVQLDYQGLANQSQNLDLALAVPNVLSTDFGVSPSLNLYKQDTSFLNLNVKIAFDYLLSGYNKIRVFVENRNTNLIATQQYSQYNILPPVLDASTTFYGLGLNFETLNYRFNPRSGYVINVDAGVGNRQIRQNGALNPILYQNIALSSTAYRFNSRLNYYKSLSKTVVLALSNETGVLSAKNIIENELFRIGGQRSLRGFNEMSILASSYTFANMDLRYLFAENSFLFVFYNQAFVHLKTAMLNQQDYPLGFGTGINFETNIGVLSVTYALGKQQNNPLNLRQGKIHFGLVALF